MNYIFDFDGTIADSMPAMISVYNQLIRGEDNPLTDQEISILRGMSSRRAIRHLGVRWWHVPKLLLIGTREFHSLIGKVQPIEGMPEVIAKLYENGDRLFILTSNTNDNVRLFLEKNKLDKYFEKVYGGVGLFKKSKVIRRLLKENNLKRKETLYIGDETRDIRAAKLARVRIVAVSWGLNDSNILRRSKPSILIDFPLDILKPKIWKKHK